MKQGFEMYRRAVAQLISNILPALRATAPAWILLTILTSAAAYFIVSEPADPAINGRASDAFSLPPYFWTYFMISQVMNFMTLGYIGPKFHRAILPENTTDLLFPYNAYMFGLMQLGLIGVGLGFLASRIISVISQTLPGPLGDLTVPILFLIGVLYVMLRFSLILPSIAMGRQKTLHEAWMATGPFRYAALTSLILLIATIAALHSLALIWQNLPWVSLILGSVASWFALMVVLSYLNVTYRASRKAEIRAAQRL